MNMLSAAVLATMMAVAVAASAQAPASKPIQPAEAQAPAQPQAAKKARASRKVPSTADARVCLEFPNDMQIVKCSEKYRWQQASSQ